MHTLRTFAAAGLLVMASMSVARAQAPVTGSSKHGTAVATVQVTLHLTIPFLGKVVFIHSGEGRPEARVFANGKWALYAQGRDSQQVFVARGSPCHDKPVALPFEPQSLTIVAE